MYRLSLIISEIYNKYLPLAEKNGIALNLDFADTTATIADPDELKKSLDQHLESALSRTERGEISIAVTSTEISITDSGTILSRPLCALLSNDRISVRSRVGFGTTVRISLAKPTPIEQDPASAEKQPASTRQKFAPAKLPQPAETKLAKKPAKTKTKIKTKAKLKPAQKTSSKRKKS